MRIVYALTCFHQVLFTAYTIVVIILAIDGGGRHEFYLSTSQVLHLVKVNFIAQPFGIAATGIGKISVAFLILRILDSTALWRWQKCYLWCTIMLTSIFTILPSVFLFTQCKSPKAIWTPSLLLKGHCWKPHVVVNFLTFTSSKLSCLLVLN